MLAEKQARLWRRITWHRRYTVNLVSAGGTRRAELVHTVIFQKSNFFFGHLTDQSTSRAIDRQIQNLLTDRYTDQTPCSFCERWSYRKNECNSITKMIKKCAEVSNHTIYVKMTSCEQTLYYRKASQDQDRQPSQILSLTTVLQTFILKVFRNRITLRVRMCPSCSTNHWKHSNNWKMNRRS